VVLRGLNNSVNSLLIPCKIEKNRRKKSKTSVNLEFIRVHPMR